MKKTIILCCLFSVFVLGGVFFYEKVIFEPSKKLEMLDVDLYNSRIEFDRLSKRVEEFEHDIAFNEWYINKLSNDYISFWNVVNQDPNFEVKYGFIDHSKSVPGKVYVDYGEYVSSRNIKRLAELNINRDEIGNMFIINNEIVEYEQLPLLFNTTFSIVDPDEEFYYTPCGYDDFIDHGLETSIYEIRLYNGVAISIEELLVASNIKK